MRINFIDIDLFQINMIYLNRQLWHKIINFQKMKKKKKSLEELQKFQLNSEKNKMILAGTRGYVPPSWAPTTQTCAGNCTLNIYPDGHSESTGDSISLDWD